MENLRAPKAKVLINSLDEYRVGLFQDTITGRKVLTFKEEGINIQGDVQSAGVTPALIGPLPANITVSKTCTNPGALEFEWIEFFPPCPCGVCGWEYSLTIERHVKDPGVGNNDTNSLRKTYSGDISTVSCTVGPPSLIDDALVLAAEDDLITQIAFDTGHFGDHSDVYLNNAVTPCEARRVYEVTPVNVNNIVITVEGVAYTVAMGATSLLSAHAINNTAVLQQYVMAFSIRDNTGDMRIGIMSRTNGQLFTVTIAAGACTVNHRYIALLAKDAKVQFAAIYDANEMGATTTKHHLYFLTGHTAAGTTTVNTTVAGTAISTGAAGDLVADAAYSAAIQVVIDAAANALADNAAASYDVYGGYVLIYGSTLVDRMSLTFSAASTTTIFQTYYATGIYPILTGADVFRIFSNQKDAGRLAQFTYLDQVNPDDEYCVYTLKSEVPIYGQGVSRRDQYLMEVDVYVLKSLTLSTVLFLDSTNPAATGATYTFNQQRDTNAAALAAWTPDTSLETLLGIWCGLAVANW